MFPHYPHELIHLSSRKIRIQTINWLRYLLEKVWFLSPFHIVCLTLFPQTINIYPSLIHCHSLLILIISVPLSSLSVFSKIRLSRASSLPFPSYSIRPRFFYCHCSLLLLLSFSFLPSFYISPFFS